VLFLQLKSKHDAIEFRVFGQEQLLGYLRTVYRAVIPLTYEAPIMISITKMITCMPMSEEIDVVACQMRPPPMIEIVNHNIRKGNEYHICNITRSIIINYESRFFSEGSSQDSPVEARFLQHGVILHELHPAVTAAQQLQARRQPRLPAEREVLQRHQPPPEQIVRR
jgi:hypothetical protein